MPIRYVGRQGFFIGKSLNEIARNLKNCGVGRVVARSNFLSRYPEKSFYRLTKVIPDMTETGKGPCLAWGMRTFRGEQLGEYRIDAGKKTDWILIPKDEEESFCKINTNPRTKSEVPTFVKFPPLLEALIKQEMETNGEDISKPLKLHVSINKGIVSRIKEAAEKNI